MVVTNRIAGARLRAGNDLGRALRAMAGAVAREIRTRRQVAYLMRQDDRMLRDIGLSRAEILRAVRGRYF
jgi:uncharacterized protein YjiS (DUF1127 family)